MTDVELREPDPVDWDATGSWEPKPLPDKGVYTVQETTPPTRGATNDGYLKFTLGDIKILDLPEAGTIRFTDISAKNWPGKQSNSMSDYLKAHGVKLSAKPSNAEYTAAVGQVTGRPVSAGLDWKGKCKVCNTYFSGQDKFPVDAEGKRQPWMDCPNGCKDPTDTNDPPRPFRVFANAVIKYWKNK